MAEETKLEEKVEETKEAVEEAVEKAEEAVEKVEAAAEKADEPKVEAAAEKAEEALEKVEEAIEKHEAAEAKAEVEVPKHFKDVVEKIEKMTVLELAELVKVLEEKFGVSAAPVAVAAAGGGAAGGAEAAEEKSAYNIMLDAAGDQKINVIKAVREITGLGLAESKALVDGAPKEIKQNVPKAEAEEAVTKLKEAGATASLK